MIDYSLYKPGELTEQDLKELLHRFDCHFIPNLSKRQSLDSLSYKFNKNAYVILCTDRCNIIGFIVFYFNPNPDYSYVSLLAVETAYREQSIGRVLMAEMIKYCELNKSKGIKLEVRADVEFLIKFYKSFHFDIFTEFQSEFDGNKKYYMKKEII